jgi:hypothetical protein
MCFAPGFFVLLGAATDPVAEGRERLRSMTPQQRTALAAALKQFDLRLGPAEQKSLRELDAKLNALPPDEKQRHRSTLRRYYNWLNSLPESQRDELLAMPTDRRLEQVRKLAGRYPPPAPEPPLWIRFSDLTGPSPFELAALFKVWSELTPQQRKEIEQAPPQLRLFRLHAIGRRSFQIPRELQPADFDARQWLARADAKLAEFRISGAELRGGSAVSEPPLDDVPNRKGLTKEQVRPIVLYRFAVNLYALERPPKAVSPDLLVRFLAEFPPWIRTTFDAISEDEARRKLTLAYRIVFPHPNEFRPRPVSVGAQKPPAASGPATTPQPTLPAPKRVPTAPPSSPTSAPF